MTTQTTDQKIINSGAMQYLMRFPAEGRLLRVKHEGSGFSASIADELGPDATPFTLALRALRLEPLPRTDQASIWAGPLEYRMPFPAEGRLFRLTEAKGGVVEVAVADELGRGENALPFTSAFRSLTVEPVLDPQFPFQPYNPGWFHPTQSTPSSRTEPGRARVE